MSDVKELSEDDLTFLSTYLPPPKATHADRPFVTLTYACSLDGMISLAPGLRTTLSGSETKSLTHHLRFRHDAILVGVGTAIPDNPGLNCRYPGSSFDTQPQPIVIDPAGRWQFAGSKLEMLARAGEGRWPWLIHASQAGELNGEEITTRAAEPAKIYLPSTTSSTDSRARIEWDVLLRALKARGVQSVMIEGGATIIAALLDRADLVDSVIITVAPTWLGQGGVLVTPAAKTTNGERVNAARLSSTAWRQFGQDAVLCGRLS